MFQESNSEIQSANFAVKRDDLAQHGDDTGRLSAQATAFVPASCHDSNKLSKTGSKIGATGVASEGGRSQEHAKHGRDRDRGRGQGGNRGRGRSERGRGRAGVQRPGGLSQAFGNSTAAVDGVQCDRNNVNTVSPPPPDSSITVATPAPSARSSQANHLLNFQSYQPVSRGRNGRGRGLKSRASHRAAPHDRNKFLAANFSFLVSDFASLERATADADVPLDWEDVLQVAMQTTEAGLTCPISLRAPVAPQITPCGHVFSFPAIVQHLVTHGGDNFSRTAPCPLCFAQLAARELKLLTTHQIEPIEVADEVEFVLLRRSRQSINPRQVLGPTPTPPQQSLTDKTSSDSADLRGDRNLPVWQQPSVQVSSAPAKRQSATAAELADRFSKFTIVSDAAPLWQGAAEELAHFAAQIIAEGGPDAAAEAPFVWIAQDLLAARAAGAAERRQKALLATISRAAAERLPSPHEAGAIAARFVKQVSTAAATSASDTLARDAQTAAMASAFPKLGSSLNAVTAAVPQGAEAAFSDEEDRGQVTGGALTGGTVQETHPGVRQLPAASQGSPPTSRGRSPRAFKGQSQEGPAAQKAASELSFWQAADGQTVFLDSLSARMLIAAGGGSNTVTALLRFVAPIVELLSVTQTAATRRRYRMLSHVPLGATFRMAEVDLSEVVPPEVSEAFRDELTQRAQRRAARARSEETRARQEAARDRAALAATMGPSAAELQAMPRPGRQQTQLETDEEMLAAALADSAAIGSGGERGASPIESISFSCMARMGYAATGPVLGSSPSTGRSPGGGGWAEGGRSGGGPLPASKPWGPGMGARDCPVEELPLPAQWGATIGKAVIDATERREEALPPRPLAGGPRKAKKKPMLLFASGQRQY